MSFLLKTLLTNPSPSVGETVTPPLTYTELDDSFIVFATGQWREHDLQDEGVPKGAVAEIVIRNNEETGENTGGVRAKGSSINRYVTTHEREGGGYTTANMLVKTDPADGKIEAYMSSGYISFYVIGYFEGCDFTEKFEEWTPASTWADKDLSGAPFSVPANAVCQILLKNPLDASNLDIGVRANNSSLDRYIPIDEAEAGGINSVSVIVKADGSSIIEEKGQSGAKLILLGWFSAVVDFTEGWTEHNPTATGWQSSTISEAAASSIIAFALTHEHSSAQILMGLREYGSSMTRYIQEHEAEGGGNTGFQICITLDASKRCEIYTVSTTQAHFYYTGYFSEV